MALTRISYACPNCMQAILQNGALEAVQQISFRIRDSYLLNLKEWVAKFLAVACYRVLPDDKVICWSIILFLFPPHELSIRIPCICYNLKLLAGQGSSYNFGRPLFKGFNESSTYSVDMLCAPVSYLQKDSGN